MQILRRTFASLVVPLSLMSLVALGGCSGSQSGGSKSIPPAGEMPADGTWLGVYFNPLFGNLHMVPTGDGVAGKWKRADGSHWGELNGLTQGNLLKYEWTEHKIGLVGPGSTTKGKGYFVYKRPPGDDVDDTLEGEWGLNGDSTGNRWDCVKQRRQVPDLKSVGGMEEAGGPSKDWK
jgi:hypothetical protein